MVSADVPDSVLNTPSSICKAADRVSVYHASNDRALKHSLGKLEGGTRVGRLGPAAMDKVHKNVWEIDCSSFNIRLNWPLGNNY
ncbi:unnamed protein product [Vitrella brassicaformis CCMP3155]|uniref:Uncharacterized protein n=1 Tax=Vitrella brassicaformis (strain CCMP3155) TaxID=1169540 RepID=A0A0G4GVH6_VITBC|nr:unnamed protein product [Vitrella brassicaformis CCMP3155]|mmetsp:Transcript_16792/g.47810  ORF Transcript_16792/g.47810 Transcript_16792/m.47810 type:complete len:84 (+) Transcript_16792:964-1215(+)|eukprot:CEM34903.1 unnamed protein product [Vitrella brassicaformis CCMP3155]